MPPKEQELNYRAAPIVGTDGGPIAWDDDTRSVEVIGATEDPVTVWDWDRGLVNEVLLMSGLEMPKTRKVVLLDSHDRYSTRSVIGSFREMDAKGGKLIGKAYFSQTPEGEGPAQKIREGHLTDFSVGYRVMRKKWIEDGKTTEIDGRTFKGPLQVVTKWSIRELSAVPIGADQGAKARNEGTNIDKSEDTKMDEKLRSFLERSGLEKDATEEEAWAYMETLGKKEEPKPEPKAEEVDVDKIRRDAVGEDRKRISEIDDICTHYKCEDMARELIVSGKTVDEARKAVMDKLMERIAEPPKYSGAEVGISDREKFRAAAEDGLLLRGGVAVDKPAIGAAELRGFTLVELARECLKRSGRSHYGNTYEMVGRAMVTDDFPYLLANVANKSLFQGWEGANETWSIWCGTGSVPDFKTVYLPRVSEASDLEEIAEMEEYKYGKRTEAQETFSIATYGKLFAISRQAIINDDLSALTTIPQAHGEAAARKVGDLPYAVLTANAAMGDSVTLFYETTHANDAGSGYQVHPDVAAIAEGIRAMKAQKDLQGLKRLNIQPKYFIAPIAIEGEAEVFFRSERFTDESTVATDSSLAGTRVNPYAGSYFTRVYDPRLDDDSEDAWYLAGPKGKTVNVYFLNGVQSPYMETKQGWSVDGVEYKVRIDAGAKAVDYRGLYRNEGTAT
jgi:phage head maturation protease